MQTHIHKTSIPSFSGALILAVLMQLCVSRPIVIAFALVSYTQTTHKKVT